MKKRYMEPQMIVEDFRVNEMVAANCVLVPNDVPVVSQMSDFDPPCPSGEGFSQEKGAAYAEISEGYEEYDHDNNPLTDPINLFTEGYSGHNDYNKYICGVDPFKAGITFNDSWNCNETSSPIINS